MFKPFWLCDVEFTRNLLSQFLEDIISYRNDLVENQLNDDEHGETKDSSAPEICFGSIVGATNSILKCIYDSSAVLCEHIGVQLLSDIVRSVLEMIEAVEKSGVYQKHYTPEQNDVIYMYANELIVIALDCRKYGVEVSEEMLLNTITLQLKSLDPSVASDEKVLIILFVIYKLIAELRNKVPLTFVRTIFTNDPASVFHQLKFSKNTQISKSIVKIYQTVLNLKIVDLIQEAYRLILDDMTIGIKVLEPSGEQLNSISPEPIHSVYTKSQAECIVNFYISTISTLAIASSSLIVMWALEPNMLELLTERLQSSNYDSFWVNSPQTHFAILSVLISHCRNNNNFISSSALLNGDLNKITDVFSKLKVEEPVEFIPGASSFNVPTTPTAAATESPTSGHFELILKYLGKILSQKALPDHSMSLLLEWCENLIRQLSAYADTLMNTTEFVKILETIINRIANETYATNKIQLIAADCIDALLSYDKVHVDTHEWIAETCCIKMCASDATVRKRYSDLFAKLPLNVSLKQVNQFTGLAKERQQHINSSQHWYLRTPSHSRGGEMRTQHFAEFIRAIKICESKPKVPSLIEAAPGRCRQIEKILTNIFVHSQSNREAKTKSKLNEIDSFCKLATADIRVLISWAQWEAAQLCVNNKLRVLGKPQETFLKIESTIKENARVLSMKEKLIVPNVDTILANQRHARILLGFMEALEKYIYNASEGTAFSLPPAEKPARTFFHVNATTCNEWFNRIRTAVDLVALHCMEPEMVIRYTESVLKSLIASGKTNEPLFDHTLMSHAWALLRNKEGDALHGLFAWTRTVTNKKYLWVKMAAGKWHRTIFLSHLPTFKAYFFFPFFLTEQANGHLEAAISGYKSILSGIDEAKSDSHFREFIFDQLTLCLANTQEWHELLDILRIEESRNIPRSTIPLLSLHSKQIETLIEYQNCNDMSVFDMADWEVLNRDSNGIAVDFSYHRLISLTENTICHMGMDKKVYDTELEKMCFDIAQQGLQECLRTKSCEHLNNLVVLNHICHKMAERNVSGERGDARSLMVDKSVGSTTLTHLLNWSEYFDNETEVGEQINYDLRLDVCSMTRKEGNLTHCRKQLEIFFRKTGFNEKIGCARDEASLEYIRDHLIANVDTPKWDANIWNRNTVRSVYEMAKWLYSYADKKDNHQEAIQFISAANIIFQTNEKNATDQSLTQERISRTILTLAEWLQTENDQFLTSSAEKPLGKLVNSLSGIRLRHSNSSYEVAIPSIITPIDLAIGKLLSFSIGQCPNLSKAYGAYGNWCYRYGRKIVELRTENDEKAGLRSADIASIADLIPNASPADIDLISNVLDQHKVSADDEEMGEANADDVASTELIESQLRQIEALHDCPKETLEKIIEIWRLANRQIYSFYEMAADAYFKYLQLATQIYDDSTVNVSNADDLKSNENCSIVTATLRILRLIVKHALGLQEVLETGLEKTPTSPWKVMLSFSII